MSSSNYSYKSGYSDLIKDFTTSKIKELLFGNPLPSFYETIAHPSSPLQSPPVLALLSRSSSVSSDTESVPEAALAFYTFIEQRFAPRLFVPDPKAYFFNQQSSHCCEEEKEPLPSQEVGANDLPIMPSKL
ncbi:hypothetical protein O181_060818 [Austropuccinia psidii MF-1]|uniref:Uncharacterized protein n=1 Tax=Austropuccinia psidii MF-1 TaxID=1389203 RepID=A0A9Q3EH31_9BASI|nr:hypothetical protein [Austropuccinia psidii MF-1]